MRSSDPHPDYVVAMPVEGRGHARARGVWIAGRRLANAVALGVLLALVVWWWFVLAVQGSPQDWAFDFRQFWQGASDVVSGASPYPDAAMLATAGDHLDPEGIREVIRFPYPAGAAVVLAPLGALDFDLAAAVWSALSIVFILAAVWILGVRDWRVLAVVVTSAPVISAVRLGTLTPLLMLLLAIGWRWRHRQWLAGGSLALAVSLKIFLWPLVVWLAATRRFAAAAIAAGVAAVFTLAAWAAIGFDGFSSYPELLRRLSNIVADRGFSLVALGVELGLPRGLAEPLPWIVGLSLLLLMLVSARSDADDRTSFLLATVASIALTPIVWLHYFALLVIPLALARPRIAWPWALMWVFWLMPAQENQGDLWRVALAIGLVCAIVIGTHTRGRPDVSIGTVSASPGGGLR